MQNDKGQLDIYIFMDETRNKKATFKTFFFFNSFSSEYFMNKNGKFVEDHKISA